MSLNDKLRKQWRAYKAGDDRAFDVIYSMLYNKQYYFTYRMLQDKYAAEDVVQETFLLVYKNMKNLPEETANIVAWINKVNYNACMSYIRNRHGNGASLDDISEFEHVLETKDEASNPELTVQNTERKNTIRDSLQSLPYSLKATVILKYYMGLKEKEIAEVLDVPQGTVKSRLSRSKTILSQKLKNVYSIMPPTLIGWLMAIDSHAITTAGLTWYVAASTAALAVITTTGVVTGLVPRMIEGVPAITSIELLDTSVPVSEQVVSVRIDKDQSIESVVLEDQTELIRGSDGEWTASVSSNGEHTVVATDKDGVTLSETFSIDNIDTSAPICMKESSIGGSSILDASTGDVISTEPGSVVVRLTDDKAGINWDSLKVTGDADAPVQYTLDREAGTMMIDEDSMPAYTYIEDKAGNYSRYEIASR